MVYCKMIYNEYPKKKKNNNNKYTINIIIHMDSLTRMRNIHAYQRSLMNRFFTTHKYSCNFEYEWDNGKFYYSDSFVISSTSIYKHRLQWVWVQRWHQAHNIRNMFDSYAYS